MPSPSKLEGWPRGLNTILRADSLPIDALRRCVNFDLDDMGKPSVRPGRTRLYAGTIYPRTLWSCPSRTLFVEAGNLKELVRRADGTYDALLVRLNVGNYAMHYLDLNDKIYYTNGVITGIVGAEGESLAWGVTGPGTQPVCVPGSSGSLFAGSYQVAITFIAADGEESGTPLAATVVVTDDGGGSITLNNFPPAPAEADRIRVYCSNRDGEGLYRVADIPKGLPSFNITTVENAMNWRLQTQFGIPPPPGDLIEYANGRILIANGSIVWLTEPLRYGLVKPISGFLSFPERVTVMKAVDDGVYICSDRTYFIEGLDTPSLSQTERLPYGGVYDTGINIPNFDAVAWFSHRGLVLGGENGEILNVLENKVAVSKYESGAMLWRENNGIRQIVANLWDGELTPYAAADYVALETVRAGQFI